MMIYIYDTYEQYAAAYNPNEHPVYSYWLTLSNVATSLQSLMHHKPEIIYRGEDPSRFNALMSQINNI